jgi:pimeloyl-ACP methyl ester carboxylesterase
MISRRTFNVMAASGAVSAMTSQFGRAEDVTKAQNVTKAKNVVLVHGLYADGSSWLDVIAHLQTAGLNATAVQNPLMSLEADSAAVRRILAQQDGPTVLVGHSFAGTLISETGGDSIVSALVYVAARAPDAGEDFGALAAKFPKPPASAGTVKGDGYFWLNQEASSGSSAMA